MPCALLAIELGSKVCPPRHPHTPQVKGGVLAAASLLWFLPRTQPHWSGKVTSKTAIQACSRCQNRKHKNKLPDGKDAQQGAGSQLSHWLRAHTLPGALGLPLELLAPGCHCVGVNGTRAAVASILPGGSYQPLYLLGIFPGSLELWPSQCSRGSTWP